MGIERLTLAGRRARCPCLLDKAMPANVWNYPGVNTFGKDRGTELAMHPTVKPVALVADAILDCSKRGGIILDVFAASGTTLIAAEKAGRRGYGIEIDCHYTDIIIRRFDEVYGLKAVHEDYWTMAPCHCCDIRT
jgi:DNA modification methylase